MEFWQFAGGELGPITTLSSWIGMSVICFTIGTLIIFAISRLCEKFRAWRKEVNKRRKEMAAVETRKYIKKPVVVEAYQTPMDMVVETLEGRMHANAGDYIITGVRGEQYPCKKDIFEETYELVEEEE